MNNNNNWKWKKKILKEIFQLILCNYTIIWDDVIIQYNFIKNLKKKTFMSVSYQSMHSYYVMLLYNKNTITEVSQINIKIQLLIIVWKSGNEIVSPLNAVISEINIC